MGGLLLGGRGRLTSAAHRRKAIELISEEHAAGASLVRACSEIGICLRTLKRWQKALIGDRIGDRRKGSPRRVLHKLSEEERQRILLNCKQADYAPLPPGQIVPALADQGLTSVPRAAFVACSTPMDRCIGAIEHGYHRNQDQCQGSGSQGPIRFGAGTSPICPPPCAWIWLYLYLVIDF